MLAKFYPQNNPILTILFLFVFGFLTLPVFLSNRRVNADIGGLVTRINEYRSDNDLTPLKEDQKLVDAACWLANNHAENDGSGHIDSLGRNMSKRLSDFGVDGTKGENVARWTDTSKPATYAFDLWKDSPGHNALMLEEDFTRIGVGSDYGSGWQHFVADFANGSASTVTNQCGVTTSPKPTTANTTKNSQSSENTPKESPAKPEESVKDPESKPPRATSSTPFASISVETQPNTPSTVTSEEVKSVFSTRNITLAILFMMLLSLSGIWFIHKRKHHSLL